MKYGVRLRIYPNKEQEELLFYYCKVAHRAWNFLVAKYKDSYKLPIVGVYGIKDYLPKDLASDMNEVAPQRLYLGVLKTYAHTIDCVFKKLSNRPKFHKANPKKQSFYFSSKILNIKNNHIKLIVNRQVKFKNNLISVDVNDLDYYKCTDIIEPRFTYQNKQWYVSGCFNVPDIDVDKSKEYLGLDWGIKNFMTASNGEIYNYPKSIVRRYNRIKRLQHYLDKKQKGSNNYNKLLQRINKSYERMNNIKKDYVEQLTTKLCRQYHIVIEDIDMRQFLLKKSKKKFIRQNSIIQPYYLFKNKLEWKCQKFGSYFIKIEPNNTSKTCSKCGHVYTNLKLKDRVYICHKCGYIIDRDLNAAINIREKGKNLLA